MGLPLLIPPKKFLVDIARGAANTFIYFGDGPKTPFLHPEIPRNGQNIRPIPLGRGQAEIDRKKVSTHQKSRRSGDSFHFMQNSYAWSVLRTSAPSVNHASRKASETRRTPSVTRLIACLWRYRKQFSGLMVEISIHWEKRFYR